LTVSVVRKEGRPSYGSEGASCEITMDVAERSVSEAPESLVSEIRRAYALCDQAVSEQLARSAPAGSEAEPAPRQPDRTRPASQARPPSEPEPDRPARRGGGYDSRIGPDGAARWQNSGAPKSGRELIAWSRKREESGETPGLFKRLVWFGESQNFPPRVVDWSRDEVNDALGAVLGRGFGEDEPAPVRNGYHR
jgi:hypothetical protein